MAAPPEGKKIALTSSDGEEFVVEQAVAMESQMIRDMIEVDCADGTIPVANVNSTVLTKVLEYCMRHAAVSDPKGGDDEELKAWDAEFVKVDLDTLYDLLLAANYLNVKGLLDLICRTVANIIRGKTPDEIRETFKIKNDFTPEQEEEYRKKNSWVFETIEDGAL